MTEIHEQNNGSLEVIKISKLGFVCCKQLASCFFTIIQRTRFLSQKDTYTQLLVIFSTGKDWIQSFLVQKRTIRVVFSTMHDTIGWNLLQNKTIGVIFSTGMNAKEEISSSTV
jgi:hypothetical protein